MSERRESSNRGGQSAEADADHGRPLAFEAEFDGLRRPQSTDVTPCDLARYWEFFSSGTD